MRDYFRLYIWHAFLLSLYLFINLLQWSSDVTIKQKIDKDAIKSTIIANYEKVTTRISRKINTTQLRNTTFNITIIFTLFTEYICICITS